MTKNKLELGAVWLALGAGGLDLGTGLGLVAAPVFVLGLMGAAAPGPEGLLYLRWVGAFVAAVGWSYLWALVRRDVALLRHTLELTMWFRVAAGLFSAWAVATGRLDGAWAAVPATDCFLAAAQAWLLRRGVFRVG
jgi:hypothetical protein